MLTGLFTVTCYRILKLIAVLCLCCAVLLTACEQPKTTASTRALPSPERLVLTQAEQAEVLAALRSITQGRTLVNRPRSTWGGFRWSDVPRAAGWAIAEAGVEMAIVQTLRHDEMGKLIEKNVLVGEGSIWVYTFRLKTVEDRPAELIVRRRHDQRVYDATATVGRFADDHQRAEALLAAFDKMMSAFGRKRGFNDQEP